MPDVRDIFPDPAVTALATAVRDGDAAQVRELARDAPLDAQGDKAVTLPQWAILNQQPESLQALLDAGADPALPGIDGNTALHTAAMADDPRYLEILLGAGADPDAPHGRTGATPLAAAVMGERRAQLRMLLAAGADPDRADRMGNTPLHIAGKINAPDLALELLQAGASADARNGQGVTFQRYLAMTPAAVQSETVRAQRQALEAWLRDHDVPIEDAR
ncbi:ankyrin repeat domain-containing protein [Coralloluteibacterium stylophorae]|uniref:Ankyrin repeat domain-containing protein n=1 Tax=Coralloluteibacterium stylophorae TaxID=1776034 RepID=A0A8J8AWC7_9GAMM|nr:ankyrin repeat domain-containing protein [Coralloluteibacterium stylophorae]MBS7457149.1 ankyrin repeat domain-containing protein [Coralloluteibacterium stylophorae]